MSDETRVTSVNLSGAHGPGVSVDPSSVTLLAGLGAHGIDELRHELDRFDTIDLGAHLPGPGEADAGLGSEHRILEISGPSRRIPLVDARTVVEGLAAIGEAGSPTALDAAVGVLEQRLSQARVDHDEASAELATVTTELRAERQFLDSFAAATHQQAQAALAEMEAELGVEPGTDTIASPEVIAERLAVAEAQLAELKRRLARHAPTATARINETAASLRRLLGDVLLQSTDAQGLADELLDAQAELMEIEERVAGYGPTADELTEALEVARLNLAEVERRSRGPQVDSDDIAALEAAHDAVLAAEQKASGRLPNPRAKRALEEARAAEQEILDRLGFPTWSAFMMESTNYGASRDARRQLSQAIAARDDAELAWNGFHARLEAEPGFREAFERLATAHDTAVALVGPADDLEQALRLHRVDLNGTKNFEAETAAEDLAHALTDVGVIAAGTMPDPVTLLARADAWLGDVARNAQNRSAYELERGRVEVEIRTLQTLAARQSADGSADIADVRLADARSAVAAARGRLDRHRGAVRRIAQLTQRSEELAAAIAERAEVMASVADLVAVTAVTGGRQAPAGPAPTTVRAMVAELAGVTLRDLVAQPLVVVVDDADVADLPELGGAMSAVAEVTQLLVVSDAPEVAAAVHRIGGTVVTAEIVGI